MWAKNMTRKKRGASATSRVSLLMQTPREVGAAEFKARCLELMSEVERLGTEIVITRHRKPIARLVPAESRSSQFYGCLKGMILWEGDVVSPIDVEWSADDPNLT
jgi:prevent-host-death family protein